MKKEIVEKSNWLFYPSQKTRVKKAAKKLGVSESQFARQAIEEKLEKIINPLTKGEEKK